MKHTGSITLGLIFGTLVWLFFVHPIWPTIDDVGAINYATNSVCNFITMYLVIIAVNITLK